MEHDCGLCVRSHEQGGSEGRREAGEHRGKGFQGWGGRLSWIYSWLYSQLTEEGWAKRKGPARFKLHISLIAENRRPRCSGGFN